MKTLTLEIGWYPEEVEHGPPLPHSLWLWELWGCYEHYNCVIFVDPRTPKGERDRLIHTPLEELRAEVEEGGNGYRHSGTCECWIHWLLGNMSHKDYPQTYEPIIHQSKKGRRDDL